MFPKFIKLIIGIYGIFQLDVKIIRSKPTWLIMDILVKWHLYKKIMQN